MMHRRRFCQSIVASAVASALPARQLLAADHQVVDSSDAPISAITGNGRHVELARAAVNELGGRLAGQLLTSGDDGYESARRVLNDAIDKHPALIARCTGAADVSAAVEFANEHGLLTAVKCGGHSYGGKSTCDDGLMIDLTPLRGVRVDPTTRTARVAGGSLLGPIDHESMAFGLVTTAGTVSHTGVGGLTTGGGYGRLARRFGLALDNVLSVDVVTADGQLRHADAQENPDLYWGVRGGGGNFGVVTSFEFGLHPMQRRVVGGELMFPGNRARDLLEFYAEYSAGAPDDVYCDFAIGSPPGGGDGYTMLHICYSGPESRAEAALAPFRKLGKPNFDGVRGIDYVALQSAWDESDPRAVGEYLKSGFTTTIDGKLIDTIIAGFEPHPERMTQIYFQQAGGQIARVSTDATAFPHRYAQHAMFSMVTWELGADGDDHMRWLKQDYWASLQPFTNGMYVNEVANESQAFINMNYQGNYERLVRVKTRYDPGNLFRLNANVQPTG